MRAVDAVRTRLPRLSPADMNQHQLALYEKFSTGRRAEPSHPFRLIDDDGFVLGPAEAWQLSPMIGLALESLGDTLEMHASISRRSREMLILAIASRRDCSFELYTHRIAGRHAGLTPKDIQAIEAGGAPEFEDDTETAIWDAACKLLDQGTLLDADYWRAVESLGLQVLVDVVSLVTYFDLVSTHLSVFAIQPPNVASTSEGRG